MNNSIKSKPEVTIGLDLGVGSVGWAIVDNETNIIHHLGSRLFSQAKTAEDRRSFRGVRRLIRRRKYKLKRFVNLIWKYNSYFGFKNKEDILNNYQEQQKLHNTVLNLKLEALNAKIDPKALSWILHDYLKNRGHFYEDNRDFNVYPTEELANYFDEFGYYKGIIDSKNDDDDKSEEGLTKYKFSNQHWLEEVKKVLSNQTGLPEKFKEEYESLFSYVRNYSEGPGSINSVSPYGIYHLDEKEGKVVQKYNNIWDKTIGKCSIFPDEYRAPKNSPIAMIFNEINELSTIRSSSIYLISWFINQEFKKAYLNKLLDLLVKTNSEKPIDARQFKKLREETIAESIGNETLKDVESEEKLEKEDHKWKLKGLKLNTNGKIQYNDLSSLAKFVHKLKQHLKLDFLLEDQYTTLDKINFLQSLFVYLGKHLRYSNRVDSANLKEFSDSNKLFERVLQEQKDGLFKLFEQTDKDDEKILAQTQSLSTKAMLLAITRMTNLDNDEDNQKNNDKGWNFEAIKNFDQKFIDITKTNNNLSLKQNKRYLDDRFINDAILSPGVKRILREATKVFNAILKQFSEEYDVTKIVIELARELSEEKELENTKNYEKLIKKNSDKISERLKALDIAEDKIKATLESPTKSYKVLLWLQQDHIDPYSQKEIAFQDILTKTEKTEIDHIIPYSISFDDSSSNKLLVLAESNQAKSNQTPYEFISSGNAGIKWEDYEAYCRKFKDGDTSLLDSTQRSKKFAKMMKTDTSSKYDIGFLARNLNDTRYATIVFRDALKDYANNHLVEDKPMFKVVCINGGVTSFLRKNFDKSWYAKKDRDKNIHHAVDASIISIFSNKTKTLFDQLTQFADYKLFKNTDGSWKKIDPKTGVVTEVTDENWKQIRVRNQVSKIAEEIDKCIQDSNIERKARYSRKIENKTNISLFNDTVYSAKKVGYDDQIKRKNLKTLDIDESVEENKNSKVKKQFVYRKLVNVSLLNNDKLADLFAEKEDILMYRANPWVINLAEQIFNEYTENRKIKSQNVFGKYMLDLTKEFPEKFSEAFVKSMLRNKTAIIYNVEKDVVHRIKRLKILSSELKENKLSNVIIRSKNESGTKLSYQDTINSIALMIMRSIDPTAKKQYIRVPLNTLNLHLGDQDFDLHNIDAYLKKPKFVKYLKANEIGDEYKPWRVLTSGTLLIHKKDKKLMYISSFQNLKDVIEIKNLIETEYKENDDSDPKKKKKANRFLMTLSTILNDYILLDAKDNFDILGLSKNRIDEILNSKLGLDKITK
ncbi:type II CRISPR RNA-guided endonuclease Cas9 [Mycoplasmoides gallisepticum]